jgi:hypothetical protein
MNNRIKLPYFGLKIRLLVTDFFRIRNVYFGSGSDRAKSFGSFRIRIRNTAGNCNSIWVRIRSDILGIRSTSDKLMGFQPIHEGRHRPVKICKHTYFFEWGSRGLFFLKVGSSERGNRMDFFEKVCNFIGRL